MKAKDWQNTAKLIRERQSQVATADSSKLSSFSLSELPADVSGPPAVLQGPYVPLSRSTPVQVPQGNQQMTNSAQDESPFQQVIPNILQQSLYPSLAALGTSLKTAVSPPIPFSRRDINDISEQQRKALEDTVEGTIRLTNTSPTSDLEEQDDEVIIPSIKPTSWNNTSRYPRGNSTTGVFRNRRHQHQKDSYMRRPKDRTHRSPEYRGYR